MEAIQKINKYLTSLIIIVVIFSCVSDSVFSSYKAIPNNSWLLNKKVGFNFVVTDTISKQNLYINVRNNNNYKYSNLFLITELVFPNKTKVVDTLHYQMADPTGSFLGKGFTNIKENKLFYKEDKVFQVSGEYSFNVRHAMRKNGFPQGIKYLKGIMDVGLSIEKSK